jgi:hypothetical protein
MDVILFETTSTQAADEIVAAVEASNLWGVDMGTTSKAAAYSTWVVVEATATRVSNLLGSMPEGVDMELHHHEIHSFTDASSEEKLWHLRGKF